MMIRFATIGLAVVAMAANGPGQVAAAVVDFEDVAPTSVIEPQFGALMNTTLTSGGFLFDSPDNFFTNHSHLMSAPFHGLATHPAYNFYATNGTQYIGHDSSIITMSSTSSVPFDLLSFDAAEGHLQDPDYQSGGTDTSDVYFSPWTAHGLEVEGTLASGGTVSAIYHFDGINDSVLGTEDDFQSFVLPSAFRGLTSVAFHGLDDTDQRAKQIFSIDNVAVTRSSVPEPTALAVWSGLAALGLIAARRRKRYV